MNLRWKTLGVTAVVLGAAGSFVAYKYRLAERDRQWIHEDPPLPKARGGRSGADSYINPVGRDITLADPFLLRDRGRYYLYGTRARGGFRYYHSEDLVTWQGGDYYYDTEHHPTCIRSFWAPEVHAYQGAYYLIFSCDGRTGAIFERSRSFRLVLAKGERPEGPFRDVEIPWLGLSHVIDPHLFFDGDRIYVYYVRVGSKDGVIFGEIWGAELQPDLRSMKSPPRLMSAATPGWEIDKPTNLTNEGPYVFKREGSYYLVYSANFSGSPNYAVGYARASSPLGPWTKSANNPVLSTNTEANISGVGHASVAPSPDDTELFLFYHSFDPEANHGAIRNVNMERMLFDARGEWTTRGPTRTPQALPNGTPHGAVRGE